MALQLDNNGLTDRRYRCSLDLDCSRFLCIPDSKCSLCRSRIDLRSGR